MGLGTLWQGGGVEVLLGLYVESRLQLATTCRVWSNAIASCEQRDLQFRPGSKLSAGPWSRTKAFGRGAVRIGLSGVAADDATLRVLLQGLPVPQALEELDLSLMCGASWKCLRPLPRFPRLRVLRLGGITVSPELVGYLGRLPTAESLEELDMSYCLGLPPGRLPTDLASLGKLRVLNLQGFVPEASVEAAAGAACSRCPALRGAEHSKGGALLQFLLGSLGLSWQGEDVVQPAAGANGGSGCAATLEVLNIDTPHLASPEFSSCVLALVRHLVLVGCLRQLVLPRGLLCPRSSEAIEALVHTSILDVREGVNRSPPARAASIRRRSVSRRPSRGHWPAAALSALPRVLPTAAPLRRGPSAGRCRSAAAPQRGTPQRRLVEWCGANAARGAAEL